MTDEKRGPPKTTKVFSLTKEGRELIEALRDMIKRMENEQQEIGEDEE